MIATGREGRVGDTQIAECKSPQPTLTVLNSSHSASTKFMCLSYASICPTSDRPSFLRECQRGSAWVRLVVSTVRQLEVCARFKHHESCARGPMPASLFTHADASQRFDLRARRSGLTIEPTLRSGSSSPSRSAIASSRESGSAPQFSLYLLLSTDNLPSACLPSLVCAASSSTTFHAHRPAHPPSPSASRISRLAFLSLVARFAVCTSRSS